MVHGSQELWDGFVDFPEYHFLNDSIDSSHLHINLSVSMHNLMIFPFSWVPLPPPPPSEKGHENLFCSFCVILLTIWLRSGMAAEMNSAAF